MLSPRRPSELTWFAETFFFFGRLQKKIYGTFDVYVSVIIYLLTLVRCANNLQHITCTWYKYHTYILLIVIELLGVISCHMFHCMNHLDESFTNYHYEYK